MLSSTMFGNLILLAAAICFVIGMRIKQDKEYKKGMAKYEEDMAAYQEAVARLESLSAPSAAAPAVAYVSGGNVNLYGVEESTAAIIMAIVSQKLGGDPARLRFESIRAL